MFETHDWAPFLIVFFQFLKYHVFVVFSINAFTLFTGTCIAVPSPEKKIAYKTFFALNERLAYITGPSCSKLTMKLVTCNVSLKLWSLNIAYMQNFCWKNVSSFCICKSYSRLFSKNTCEFGIVLSRTVNILTTNELVKLATLWTTGLWSFAVNVLSLKIKWIHNIRYVIV